MDEGTVIRILQGYIPERNKKERMKDTEYEKHLEKRQEETGGIIQKLCWDQDRFIRGYTEAGDRIGAAKDQTHLPLGITRRNSVVWNLTVTDNLQKDVPANITDVLMSTG